MKNQESQINDNKEKNQFELRIDGKLALASYTIENDLVYINHTEVPHEMEGKGIGSFLVKSVLQNIESRNLKVVPVCPFVADYIDKNPEWKKIANTSGKE